MISSKLHQIALLQAAFASAALCAGAALADDEPLEEPALPCRGDACAGVPEGARTPLLVAADTVKPPPPPPPRPPPRHRRSERSEAAGPRITFGRAFTPSIANGWAGRFDAEFFEVRSPGILSVRIGLEGWGSSDGGGGGIPWAVEGGLAVPFTQGPKSPRFVLMAGLGWEWAYYDRIRHVGQFGIFSPIANATMGIDFRGVRLFGEGSAQYRWGWGDADRAQYRVSVSLSLDSELWDGPSH